MPTYKWVYNTSCTEIINWIESHHVHMWKYYDIPEESWFNVHVPISAWMGKKYIFTEELESWFLLRWS